MNMKSNRFASLTFGHLAAMGLVAACASAPPPRELLDARAAYSPPQAGPAAQLAPATMQDANVAVKNDTRGTVITIPGSVLFATGKTDLLPGAQTSLEKVADALKDQKGSQISVNGYTDSTGSEQKNMQVSQDRADHVRDYLV